MNLNESFRVAIRSMRANSLRTSLTMLGMMIGVAAVITLMSIGQGAQAAVTAQFNTLGTNLVFVTPGTTSQGGVRQQAGSTNTLTADDATAIADPSNDPSVLEASPEISTFGQIIYQGQNTNGRVYGVTPGYSTVHNYQVSDGVWFSDSDVQSSATNVVFGAAVAQTLFGGVDPVGQTIYISSGPGQHPTRVLFTVIGVGVLKGGSGFDNPDTAVYAPLTTVQTKLFNPLARAGGNAVNDITVKAVDANHVTTLEQEITTLLLQRHNISDPTQADFSVTSQQDQMQARQQVTQVLTLFLAAVAGISLIVGGIGIMNIMIVSVTERTREIGIRKAVGARRRDILAQFLTESLLVSVLGGLSGIAGGLIAARVVNGMQLNGQALQTLVTIQSILLAAGVSCAIGLFFGLYPATRAARLQPVEALHYE